jgi:hypothetical protein
MSSVGRGAEFWAKVVAEAKSGVSREELMVRHGVTKAALKYHLYKKGKRSPRAEAPMILPVRVPSEVRWLELELGSGMRLRFPEGSDSAYVAAVASKLR